VFAGKNSGRYVGCLGGVYGFVGVWVALGGACFSWWFVGLSLHYFGGLTKTREQAETFAELSTYSLHYT
jgi:hypothetical protein